MGLHTIIKKQKRKEKEIRILMLGLDNAGKSTIVKKISGEDVMTISPTVGFNIKTLIWGPFKLNIWDIGGQRVLRGYWRNYFEYTDAIVWTVDLTDRIRLSEGCSALKQLLKEDRLLGTILLILGNKCDIESAMEIEELKLYLEVEKITSHKYNVFKISAMSGIMVYEAFKWLIEEIENKKYRMLSWK
ncbi:unnamed protein product [Pneumocystis jirovecii]|uniref:ADP-ribosylation factor-like protein 2 n=2 Tax=Pneumocystis jirovecii TaxID=42068 RepID=L0PGT3_PNEJI|nr:uncharacterized protein T551_00303 [Pneumocystis jirovecii RU7]KTW32818.1 hypothetical protein T551_00303 [Pneumocystis jirovecii RU7]CCJ30845.1 unnamed protein product [Pneumocystis jirovecii]